MKAAVKMLQDQNTAMIQQNGAMSQLIAAMAEDGKTNRQQIAALVQREANRSMSQQDCKQTDNSRFRR